MPKQPRIHIIKWNRWKWILTITQNICLQVKQRNRQKSHRHKGMNNFPSQKKGLSLAPYLAKCSSVFLNFSLRDSTLTHTHTHTHTFNGPFPRTTRVGRYQKGKTNLDFTEARYSEWQWHQLGICKSAPRSRQTTTPAPHHSAFYRPDAFPAAQPTASKHWRHKTPQ